MLIHFCLSILILFTLLCFVQALVHIITPAFRYQVGGIYREMTLTMLPYGSWIMLLDSRVNNVYFRKNGIQVYLCIQTREIFKGFYARKVDDLKSIFR